MKYLTYLLLVVFIVTTIWMSVVARSFQLSGNNPCNDCKQSTFSIMDLELMDTKSHCQPILIDLMPASAKKAVVKQLDIDYLFMVGCYLGIASMCILAYQSLPVGKASSLKKILLVFALAQLGAWLLDIWENTAIEKWIISGQVSGNAQFFNFRTYAKFLIGIGGFLLAVVILVSCWLRDRKEKAMLSESSV